MKKTTSNIWSGMADTSWHNAKKKQFTITTAEQLAGLAELVNSGNEFKGKTFKLGANIALNDTANWQNWENNPPANEWFPIGKYVHSFCGTFDGCGFTISGVYINNPVFTTPADYEQGLFGYVLGEIKNLGVIDSYIKGDRHVGGIAGLAENINNCYFKGIVIGNSFTGELAGFCRSKIKTEVYYEN